MICFYLFCLIVSIGMFFWLCISDVKRNAAQFIFIILVILSNLGYVFLALSKELREALLAQKFVYISGIFLPMVYLMLVCEASHVKLGLRLMLVLLAVQIAIYCAVLTIGVNDWYYASVKFEIVNGIGHISREYGPLHALYPTSMIGYNLAALIIIVIAITRKNFVHKKDLKYMLVCTVTVTVIYMVGRRLNLPFDPLPFSYSVLAFGAFIPIYHSSLFTVQENREIVDEQLDKLAYITFDRQMRFMGCNKLASQIFPELIGIELGKTFSTDNEVFNKNVINNIIDYMGNFNSKKLKKHEHKSIKTFKVGDRYYDGKIHVLLSYNKKIKGFTLELTDETEHYYALELSENYNETLLKEIDKKTERIRFIQEKTIIGMAQMVESRDLSTGGHIKRTSDVVHIFAKKLLKKRMGLDRNYLRLVIRSAPMHDLGKIGVRDTILRKQGRFEPSEYEEMKTHSAIGARMVRDILEEVEETQFVEIAENVAHYHHEKVDGTGYPDGLKGDEIPLEARIMALADVFDALVSKRCYKEAFSYDQAFDIIRSDAGTHFDEELANIFLECRPELEEYYNQNKE